MARDESYADDSPSDVLDFWFPNTGHQNCPETHAAFWTERMQGGMDAAIISGFADLTRAAASGRLDHWADTARGRLALLIALDQFPRSLWRDTPAAYAQDIKATRLAIEGIANGHFSQIEPWEMTFYVIVVGHCEGPDHVARMHMLGDAVDEISRKLPMQLRESGARLRAQVARVARIIQTYGRHPHRNQILSRLSTPQESGYLADGDFPHLAKSSH